MFRRRLSLPRGDPLLSDAALLGVGIDVNEFLESGLDPLQYLRAQMRADAEALYAPEDVAIDPSLLIRLPPAFQQLLAHHPVAVEKHQASAGALNREQVLSLLLRGMRELQDEGVGAPGPDLEQTLGGEREALKRLMERWDNVIKVLETPAVWETFQKELRDRCPQLVAWMGILTHVHRAEKRNLALTNDMKIRRAFWLLCAVVKVGNQKMAGVAKFLTFVWDSLGATNALISMLQKVGLAVSVSSLSSMKIALQKKVAQKLVRRARQRDFAASHCVVWDNLDDSVNAYSRHNNIVHAAERQGMRHLICSTFCRIRPAVWTTMKQLSEEKPAGVQNAGVLFATREEQTQVLGHCVWAIAGALVAGGRVPPATHTPSATGHIGPVERADLQPLPAYELFEGSHADLLVYFQRVRGYIGGPAETNQQLLCPCDGYSYRQMLAAVKIDALGQEDGVSEGDSASENVQLRPWLGLFHFYWKVLLDEVFKGSWDLLDQLNTNIVPAVSGGPKFARVSSDATVEFNQADRLVDLFYQLAVLRLWDFWRLEHGADVEINDVNDANESLVQFAAWMSGQLTKLQPENDLQPMREFQRLCRSILICSVYRSMRDSVRHQDGAFLMVLLKFCVPLVIRGRHKIYSAVVIDALSFYERSSPQMRARLEESLCCNVKGRYGCGVAMDQMQEMMNLAVKRRLKLKPQVSEADLAECVLLPQKRLARELLADAFDVTERISLHWEGGKRTDILLDMLVKECESKWPPLLSYLSPSSRRKQTPLGGYNDWEYAQRVRDVLHRLGRAHQFVHSSKTSEPPAVDKEEMLDDLRERAIEEGLLQGLELEEDDVLHE